MKLKTHSISDTLHIIEIGVGTVPYRATADGIDFRSTWPSADEGGAVNGRTYRVNMARMSPAEAAQEAGC
ncbi:hypothetical protein CI15_00860 [Paraburkholderia monticola]|uniref:Uncharacterized protein n=1 Tax=Paraburkholderia monticola TaxID=1399968 RepID=A0A149Q1S0_9BURK|nr:hypothetical protein CI15_00860 [Paraburkholderia monticola]